MAFFFPFSYSNFLGPLYLGFPVLGFPGFRIWLYIFLNNKLKMQKFWVRSKRLYHLQNIKQHGHVCLHQILLLSKSHSGDLVEALKGACVVTGYVIGEEQWGTPYFYSKQQANLFVVPEGDMSLSLKVFLLHTQPSWGSGLREVQPGILDTPPESRLGHSVSLFISPWILSTVPWCIVPFMDHSLVVAKRLA